MKFFRLLDGLQRSTRITLLGCACFLGMTGLILLFLMFFPITPEEKHVVTMTKVTQQDEDKQTQPAVEFNWDDVQHSLSTWSAGIDGFSRSIDEFTGTEPEETTTDTTTSTEETDVTGETQITGFSDSDASQLGEDPPFPQTTTTTAGGEDPVPETAPPVETGPPAATEPPADPEHGENAE